MVQDIIKSKDGSEVPANAKLWVKGYKSMEAATEIAESDKKYHPEFRFIVAPWSKRIWAILYIPNELVTEEDKKNAPQREIEVFES